MSPFFLRVLLAADASQQARFWEQGLRDAGHEVVAVAPQGETALRAARLLHPDIVVVGTPLLSDLDSATLATALQADALLVVRVTEPAELMDLLAQQMARRAAESGE
ncbi:ANTAR domain-containing protein [Hymenobacter daeguensis]